MNKTIKISPKFLYLILKKKFSVLKETEVHNFFISELKKKVPDLAVFNSLSMKKKRAIQANLDTFTRDSLEFSVEKNNFPKVFFSELVKFTNAVKKHLTRDGLSGLKEKLLAYIQKVFVKAEEVQIIGSWDKIFLTDHFLTCIEFDKIYFHFVTIIVSSMEKFRLKEGASAWYANSVSRSSFLYNLYAWLEVFLITTFITSLKTISLEEKKKLKTFFLESLKKKKGVFDDDLVVTANILSMILEVETKLFLDVTKITFSNASKLVYKINPLYLGLVFFSSKLPKILPPATLNIRNLRVETLQKEPLGGQSTTELSAKCLEALNISQQKRFVIDPIFVNFVTTLNLGPDCSANGEEELIHSYPVLANIKNLENELFFLENKKELMLADSPCYLPDFKFLSIKIENVSNLLSAAKGKQKELETLLAMSKIFSGFNLYFLESLDYRGRMYPQSSIFSRTSGKYKYFIISAEDRKLTLDGIFHFFVSYFVGVEKAYLAFLSFWDQKIIAKNKPKLRKIRTWVEEFFFLNEFSTKDLNQTSNPIYFKILSLHIRAFFKNNGRTSFAIQFDQKSSSSVLLSLVLRNKKMAFYSNLTTDDCLDIREFLLENLDALFQDVNCPELKDIFINKKNLMKYCFMSWSYGQPVFGRTLLIKEFLISLGVVINDSIFLSIRKISIEFPKFLNKLFPNLSEQLRLLNSAGKLLVKHTGYLRIKSSNGSIFSWIIFKRGRRFLNVKNPYTKKFKSVVVNQSLKTQINYSKMSASFVPGLIHCMDGDLMRSVIVQMFELTNYRINHLHDSIGVCPNLVGSLFCVLKKVYVDSNILQSLKDMFFSFNKKNLKKKNRDSFLNILNQLKSLGDLKSVKGFTPSACYTREGAFIKKPK